MRQQQIVIWFSFFLVLLYSCMDEKQKEALKRISDLELKQDSTALFLALDIKTFAARQEQIGQHLRYINNYTLDTLSREQSFLLDRYRTIGKTYKSYVKEIPKMQEEKMELDTQLINLRYSLRKNKISIEEFKTYYAQEKKDVDKLYSWGKYTYEKAYGLETEYQRMAQNVEQMIKSACKKDGAPKLEFMKN